jgi:hypothetical protein
LTYNSNPYIETWHSPNRSILSDFSWMCAGMALIWEVQVLCGPRRGGTASLGKGVHREVESEGS